MLFMTMAGTLTQNNGMSVSMYHLPCVCHTLAPEIRVRLEILHVFWYIDVLTCVVYNCTEPEEVRHAYLTVPQLQLLSVASQIVIEVR